MEERLVEMCSMIVSAQARRVQLTTDELVSSLLTISKTLRDIQQQQSGDAPPVTSPERSIHRNHIECLECGKSFTLLTNRHLALHKLTPRMYKKKYGIPLMQPLSARSLTEKRRRVARELGMGKELTAWRAARKQQAS
jgi:predicted transcriptional regulator